MCGPHLPVCPWDESETPRDSRQVTGQVWSQWEYSFRPRKRMKCFLATAGGQQQAKTKKQTKKTKRNQARSLFSLHHHSQHNLLTFSHLIAFPFLATNSATLYFHHLTHIQNCFLVGAAPETKSKPLIQLQIIGWKAVTSALDRTASHGSSSSPSLDGTLFLFFILITFTNPLSYDELILPSHQLWNWLLCEHKHLKSNIIVVK